MRQTLFEFDPSAAFSFDSEASVLANQPELAVLLARIVAGWSVVEGFVSLAAASLLAGRTAVAMAMYEVLSENSTQYAALYAAADAALTSDDARLFRITLKKIRKLGAGRHMLAHGVIGSAKGLDDGIVVADQKYAADLMKIFFTSPQSGEDRDAQVRRETAAFSRVANVLRKEDLLLILQDVDRASGLAISLGMLAAPFHNNAEAVRRELLSDADVGQEFIR